MKVNVGTLSAEFPNDNPVLHGGARWVCLEVVGPPRAELPPRVTAVAPSSAQREDVARETAAREVVERESGVVVAGSVVDDDDEDVSLGALVQAVLAHGDADLDADDDIVVEELPPFEEMVSVEGSPVLAPLAKATIAPPPPDDVWTTFVSTLGGIAIGQGAPHVAASVTSLLVHGLVEGVSDDVARTLREADVVDARGAATPAFQARAAAWRGILRGTSEDFAPCGSAMLDEWAADLLARLLGQPARAVMLKRELREHGIAAFGLLDAA